MLDLLTKTDPNNSWRGLVRYDLESATATAANLDPNGRLIPQSLVFGTAVADVPQPPVDPNTGKAVKREVGPWLMKAFRVMAGLRFLRGSLLDPFRYSDERRLERRLLAQYEADVDRWISGLRADNHAIAVRLASLPEKIRGFGHVKEEQAAADV